MQPGSLKTPLLMIRVIPDKPEETQALWEACAVLSSEDPLLQAEYVRTTGEIRLQIMGKVQLEILRETLVPAASSMDYPTQFASVTGGRGSLSTALHGYRECPADPEHTMPRRGVDPLDTARYILAARSAIEGKIY